MPSPLRRARHLRAIGAWLIPALAITSQASAGSLDLYYERTLMSAADAHCSLFTGAVGSALAASAAQARGTALRAGVPKTTIVATEIRAKAKAWSTACDSPDLKIAAARVQQAFEAYAHMIHMNYPGDHAGWSADRSSSAVAVRWRLMQEVRQGQDRMMFGLAGRVGANALMAVADINSDSSPYGARLVMRDEAVTTGPYLNQQGASLASTPLSRRFSPPGAQKIYPAEARSPAGLDLLPKGITNGWAFRFPAAAAQSLAELDPREAVAIDFLFQGEVVRRVYVEVGDFAAGRAFLQVR